MPIAQYDKNQTHKPECFYPNFIFRLWILRYVLRKKKKLNNLCNSHKSFKYKKVFLCNIEQQTKLITSLLFLVSR
jgi:hypothetical protein